MTFSFLHLSLLLHYTFTFQLGFDFADLCLYGVLQFCKRKNGKIKLNFYFPHSKWEEKKIDDINIRKNTIRRTRLKSARPKLANRISIWNITARYRVKVNCVTNAASVWCINGSRIYPSCNTKNGNLHFYPQVFEELRTVYYKRPSCARNTKSIFT